MLSNCGFKVAPAETVRVNFSILPANPFFGPAAALFFCQSLPHPVEEMSRTTSLLSIAVLVVFTLGISHAAPFAGLNRDNLLQPGDSLPDRYVLSPRSMTYFSECNVF